MLYSLVGESSVFIKNVKKWLPSGESSKGAPHGVQDVPYSLEIAGSNPGYVTADRDQEFLGGGAQLAERCPGLVALLWICSAKNDGLAGALFGGRVFQPPFPESAGGL
ncbi:UNVERIFIED_CONTAM: hypothetical protein FKN15_008398 [Acipenser sinensis]